MDENKAKTKDSEPIPAAYIEFIDWLINETPEKLITTVGSIQKEYALAVIEGTESGKTYPEAGINLRALNELSAQLEYLTTDLNEQINN